MGTKREQKMVEKILEKMEVNSEDFLAAYREVTPTAMREVFIEIPTVHWEDVGGLDEVKDPAERARVADQVEKFWNAHRQTGNRLVITSRIIGYEKLRAEGLTHLTLHDFDDDAIALFLEQWCPVIERAGGERSRRLPRATPHANSAGSRCCTRARPAQK
jgi:hypothetical protein